MCRRGFSHRKLPMYSTHSPFHTPLQRRLFGSVSWFRRVTLSTFHLSVRRGESGPSSGVGRRAVYIQNSVGAFPNCSEPVSAPSRQHKGFGPVQRRTQSMIGRGRVRFRRLSKEYDFFNKKDQYTAEMKWITVHFPTNLEQRTTANFFRWNEILLWTTLCTVATMTRFQ